MRVIITGPTGAIGHALIEECLKAGDDILAICNPGSKRIPSLPQSEQLQVLELDLSEYGNAAKKNDNILSYDVFYHFAWKGTTGEGRNDKELQDDNCKAALDAVMLAKSYGCHTFIGAGSQAEYGRVEGIIKPETETNPENMYGKAKLEAGITTRELCKTLVIRHIWTRVLSVYGPYDGEKSMIISSLRKMIRGEKANFTKGEQDWDYLYSDDAGRAFRRLGDKGLDGKVYVIGSGKTKKISEYINAMTDKVKMRIKKEPNVVIGAISYSDKQVMHLCADISELKKDTGFVPSVEFEEGIDKTIEYVISTMENI